jgi:hypothetical protein
MQYSTTLPRPGEGLKTEKMPGRWVLARLGKRVLRPGGMELTRRMLERLAIKPSESFKDNDIGRIGGIQLNSVATRAGNKHICWPERPMRQIRAVARWSIQLKDISSLSSRGSEVCPYAFVQPQADRIISG